ncbi:GGDEF domain-containing protein [Malaciobacter molluscorum LMG 25693]|uniref:diguanylate cyclase n=1 Tax=Malaciobacter molluscorum LMG 25693 TaxID=870501 RepID=A0A2G1DKE3_9BACT|nr:GGDEF domain-containing protein [Malaciobacter molluscorum]AXX91363.1 diguanylate cyclase [Malaciobacter molluscorum LMG 25693]PHO18884.1 GGDEF domain-containing protein [Malaciobacter molluscorum LMG 25693]RXJ94365.1 GGDEF domain-containing protein [Malaciobacter molluscorum]
MRTKNKIIFLVIFITFSMFVLLIANLIYNFRDYGVKNIDDKAHVLAKTIEHSLTSQMVTGVIENRELFLSQLEDLPNIDKIWLSRGKDVVEMFGIGFNNEIARDEIDKEVLKTGNIKRVISENIFSKSHYRITIPYKATSQGKINCMQCHTNAKEGDTLGAITITMSIDDSKEVGITTVAHTAVIALLLMVIIIFLINMLISPFLSVFDEIKKVMSKAQDGDYSQRIDNPEGKESKDVASWINGLLEKLESSLDEMDSKISVFLTENSVDEKDHLINVKNTVDRLSDVYRFRKTIEYDDTLEEVYSRLAHVFKEQLGLKDFNFFESDTIHNKINVVYVENQLYCDITEMGCRADRTNTIIDSTQFQNVCSACKKCKETNYFCVPYSISNELDLIVSIYTNKEEETKRIRELIPYIKDYIDTAKTVIVSKKLMNILELNARTDPLTGLYNRKYLEDSIDKITAQATRANIKYGVLMVDIDHFKKVNDTYGHDVGDNAIKIVAETLIENTRESDIVIRFGGEEFIVLLYNCDEKSVDKLSLKIKEAFALKKIPAGNTTISKTMSIGTSMYPKDNDNVKDCIKYADLALYEAKETGRNKVVAFHEELLKK